MFKSEAKKVEPIEEDIKPRLLSIKVICQLLKSESKNCVYDTILLIKNTRNN